MSRFVIALVCGSLAFGIAAGLVRADAGNTNYRSELRAVQPTVPGLELRVLSGDDALELRNSTGRTVLVPGYEGEPYLRIVSDGKVEVNVRSPARYLNEDRYGQTDVPKLASTKAPPKWQVIGRGGRAEWHDHRIHWMSKEALPPQVKDEHEEAKVFDWRVPFKVGAQTVVAVGTLWWDPEEHEDEGFPVAAVAAGVGGGIVLLGAGAFLVLRRRPAEATEKPASEAW